MSSIELDTKISSFMNRKREQYPDLDLATSGRNESRTAKYAAQLRGSGQMLFS